MPKTFAELGLSESTLKALSDVGYESPSAIQEQAIPSVLEGRDVIGQAQTGTGKTAAFGLPMLQYVDPEEDDVQGLVLTPTRELCIQVTQALRAYGKRKGVDVVAVFGGAPIRSQQAQLRAGGSPAASWLRTGRSAGWRASARGSARRPRGSRGRASRPPRQGPRSGRRGA